MQKLPYNRREARIMASRLKIILNGITIAVVLLALLHWLGFKIVIQSPVYLAPVETELISPLPTATSSAEITVVREVEASTPEPTPEPENKLIGKASYYSREGCIGCSENMLMANGQPLDDSNYTVALVPNLYREYKNKYVSITHAGNTIRARVTDSGGFGKLGRVADLSLATKEALDCPDLCEVEIVLP